MKIGVVVSLLLCLSLPLQGCIPKRVTEQTLAAERYGDVDGFPAVKGSQTLQLKKTFRITLPGGWHYDPDVESRTLFNVKAVMFAWNDCSGMQNPPVFLEYKEGPRGNMPSQEELANLSPADAEDLKAALRTSTQSHLKVESVEIVSFNGLRGITVKSVVEASRQPTQMYYSLKIPVGDTLASFLFAYFERQDGPYLDKEMRDVFRTIELAKPAKPQKRRAAPQTQPASQTGASATQTAQTQTTLTQGTPTQSKTSPQSSSSAQSARAQETAPVKK